MAGFGFLHAAPARIVCMRGKEPFDIYIGRDAYGNVPASGHGMFGNPYSVEDFGRAAAIRLFSEYFENRIKDDPAYLAGVVGMRGKRLGCFCPYPKVDCHGRIYLEWLIQNTSVRSDSGTQRPRGS
jgi:hypothetical protein